MFTGFATARKAKDPNVRIGTALRQRMNKALTNNSKAGSAVRDLGCSISEFRQYIESKFQPGMSWGNYGKGREDWSLDHIVPLSRFDLTDREQFLRAAHYSNMQPLWHRENCSKGDRYVG